MKIFWGVVLTVLAVGLGFLIWVGISFNNAEMVPLPPIAGVIGFLIAVSAGAALVGAIYLFASAYDERKGKM